MNPILFLDIDGVLNSIEYAIRTKIKGIWGLDTHCVKRLQRIVDETGCDIVIMSTWRRIHTLEEISDMLVAAGMRNPVPIIGKTPVNLHVGRLQTDCKLIRGHEVDNWLNAPENEYRVFYGLSHIQKIKYCCVDDDTDFLSFQPLVKTSIEVGLTNDDADNCIAKLTGLS
jgi:Swiss Army Knife RNA repair-like protein